MKHGTPGQRAAFGEALRRRLDEPGAPSRAELGQRVAEIEGKDRAHSATAVGNWIKGDDISSPDRVFAIEQALRVKPGTLSKELGYLPLSARPVRTVLAAIEADNALDNRDRRALVAHYRGLVDDA